MTPQSGRAILLTSFFVALAIVTYQEIHDGGQMPRPKRYFSAGLVYGLLGVAAPFISYPIAGALGVGMVLALVWQHYYHPSASGDLAEVGTDEGSVNV